MIQFILAKFNQNVRVRAHASKFVTVGPGWLSPALWNRSQFPLPQAILQDRLSPAYVYITLGWFSENWWDPANEKSYNLSSSCSKEQMERALHLSLSITTDSAPSNDTTPTISGLVSEKHISIYGDGLHPSYAIVVCRWFGWMGGEVRG